MCSSDLHPELLAGAVGILLQVADAAEDEEHDTGHRHAVGARVKRMRQLVEQHGDKEQYRGEGAQAPVDSHRVARRKLGEEIRSEEGRGGQESRTRRARAAE